MAIIGPTPPVATPKKVTRRSRVDTTDIDVEKPGAAAQPQSRSQTAPPQPVSDRRKQGDRRRPLAPAAAARRCGLNFLYKGYSDK